MNQKGHRGHNMTLWTAALDAQNSTGGSLAAKDIQAIIKAEESGRLEAVFDRVHTPKPTFREGRGSSLEHVSKRGSGV